MISTDDIRVSSVVMTHPARRRHAETLCEKHPELRLRVVVDPDPDGPPSSVRTGRLAWEAADPDATHHLVLEDDVELTEDFLAQFLAAVRAQPAATISLHTACTSRTSFSARLGLLYGTPWAPVLGDYVPTVAAVLPARLATGFGRFIAERAVLTDHNDLLLKRYLDTVSVPRLITTPNLSDHLPLPSLEGNVTPDGRRSVCFIKRGGAVDWTRPPVDPPVVPYLTPTPPRRAVAFVRAGPSADPVIRPALTVLRERHVRLDFLSTEFEQARDEHTALIPHLDDILLELWRVAALLGVGHRLLIRTAARPVDIEQLLRQPLVAATLVSWADGLLEKRVTDDDRQTLSPELSTFFASGIVSGHRASPRAAVSSSRGVV